MVTTYHDGVRRVFVRGRGTAVYRAECMDTLCGGNPGYKMLACRPPVA
jgi:hypothetical protein